jgi:hypothetical protein
MSRFLNQNLSVDEIKRNYILNNALNLNNQYTQNNTNNDFMPSFDFETDIKFLINSNEFNFYQTNTNPYGLSKLSIDKYNQMKTNNFKNEEKNIKINKSKDKYSNEKEINEDNFENEKKPDTKSEKKKYKKINIYPNNNKNNSEENKKNEEDMEMENINNNLKVSSILNDTIGDNLYNNNNSKNKNEDLIDYLKKENEELKKSNEKYIQLINSLFFFINQLSKKYTPDKKLFDLSYYDSKISLLSSDLNILNQSIINQNKKIDFSISSIKNNTNKIEEKAKNKIINEKNEKNKRKKNYDIFLGRTFTFGQNDNTQKNNIDNNTNKKQNNKNKFYKENNQFKKINKSKSKNKNKNEINLLGCKIKGNNSRSKSKNKNSSITNLDNKNFNCVQNENDAIRSVKNIIYE